MSAAVTPASMLARSGSGLRGFLAWWGRGLAACLPPRLRPLLATAGDRLLLQIHGEELQLQHRHDGRQRELASLPLPLPAAADSLGRVLREKAQELPRWLLMPASLGLRRNLLLPAAAGERLREVLTFEIERQTPFAVADVLYDGHVLDVREDGQLLVELVVLPRRQLEAVDARLGGQAARLAGLDVVDADGHALGVNLLPPAQRHAPHDPWRRWNLALLAVALLALFAGMAQLLDNRSAAATSLQAGMSAREVQARAINLQRQRLVDAVEGGAYLREQRNGRASSVEVMDALAQRLPEGTYLEKLAIDGDQLTLIGLSNQAAALVGKLEGAPQWTSPALSGALQQDPRTRMDRFTLVAQLVHAGRANAAPASGQQEPGR